MRWSGEHLETDVSVPLLWYAKRREINVVVVVVLVEVIVIVA